MGSAGFAFEVCSLKTKDLLGFVPEKNQKKALFISTGGNRRMVCMRVEFSAGVLAEVRGIAVSGYWERSHILEQLRKWRRNMVTAIRMTSS
jgi:hypothetical protein